MFVLFVSRHCVAHTRSHAHQCKYPILPCPPVSFAIIARCASRARADAQARFLEEFLKQFFFEANSKEALLSFLDTKKPATMEI